MLWYIIFTFFAAGIPVNTVLHKPTAQGLFDSDEVLHISLKGSMRDLFRDRSDPPKLRSLILSYKKDGNMEIAIPVDVRTRGHFRRLKENCFYPPLMLQFPKEGPHLTSIFRKQSKLKLVMPCMGDEYIIREWLVYKIYNLITPKSFRARLVKIKLHDDKSVKEVPPFFGILLEEEKQLAERNKSVPVVAKLHPQQIQTDAFVTMAVFQYLIGNTDWSIQYLQNIKLIAKDSNAVPVAVPYDFDHAGIVKAPYAQPAEELLMSSVRERRYRGYCIKELNIFEPVIAQFNRLKDDIYSLFKECALLDIKYNKFISQYLDEFYATINHSRSWKKEFSYPCDKNGTGNIVIKGLKKD